MFGNLLEKVALALDSERLPYMVIGGQAVLLHGEPRLTKDVVRSIDYLRSMNLFDPCLDLLDLRGQPCSRPAHGSSGLVGEETRGVVDQGLG